MDGGLPGGPTWHHDLLTQMTLDADKIRPAVIRSHTAAALGEYLLITRIVLPKPACGKRMLWEVTRCVRPKQQKPGLS